VTDRKLKEKKDRVLEALEQGMTQIHLDARRPGVLVPEKFRKDHHLVLNVSYRFDPPDLSVSEWGVRQTLSFGGSRFTVAVPWSALYAVASLATREFWMFAEDLPQELAEAATEKAKLPPLDDESEVEVKKAPRAVLREVVMDKKADDDEGPSEPPTAPRRGHLRVVK
jgi:stringent starvation protein B